ncbi:hypothetical protein E2C01_097094 [Portunus trituberculatus]|uniref:Uncharacterized protein n=1 Tax=Portunus trituberculatus TaxID=210409 RepID=A0A5B7K3K9_PORTR|nr:hypothetical protein [Portunus trituberculatus]
MVNLKPQVPSISLFKSVRNTDKAEEGPRKDTSDAVVSGKARQGQTTTRRNTHLPQVWGCCSELPASHMG